VVASDPQALEKLRGQFGERVRYEHDEYAAIKGADALVICTEWNAYRSPDFDEMRARMKQPLIFDGRNLYELDVIRRRGFEYYSIGRPPVVTKAS
jgi:UDPglucose 6-dehydrogenase